MAIVQTKDPDVHSIGFDGKEYLANAGLVEVPEHVAAALSKFPHLYRRWDGLPWPREKSARELEDERIAGIAAAAAKSLQPAAAPLKKAAVKSRAKKAARPKAPAAAVPEKKAAKS